MKKTRKLTRHHIIPRSRGGRTLESNIAYVPAKEHEAYHTLFINRTPYEIMDYLNNKFWNSKYYIEMTENERR
jgi:5-methylcytosine-specific restriction endonuclease McrA